MRELEAYLVGGAVRDALLGRRPGDRDWVVVGSNPEQMEALGFTAIGQDFPVFLHPQTHEEYALARTERQQGRGHRGFMVYAEPTVTLAEDLQRRDLTINAIAQNEQGRLIDPFGGAEDIKRKTLRHVSPAFAEDPLRVLRVARFAAQLPGFSVAADTLQLMREISQSGRIRELSAERVWQECAKALEAAAPHRFFQVLVDSESLDAWFSELGPGVIDFKTDNGLLRFAELPLSADEFRSLAARLKIPNRYLQTALDWCTWHEILSHWRTVGADRLSAAFEALKASHTMARIDRMLALLALADGAPIEALPEVIDGWRLIKIHNEGLTGAEFGEALRRARISYLERAR